MNIGVECNEWHHLDTTERDTKRVLTIFDILGQVRADSSYEQLNVNLYRETEQGPRGLSLEQVDEQIDAVVAVLKARVGQQRSDGTFKPWTTVSAEPAEYFKGRPQIKVADNFPFHSIKDASNFVFGTEYAGMQRSYFIPNAPLPDGTRHPVAWFPKAAVEGKAVARGWNNVLSEDGLSMYEFNENWDEQLGAGEDGDGEVRIAFLKAKDPSTYQEGYRFVGVFRRDGNRDDNGVVKRSYTRIADQYPIATRTA